MSRLSDQLRADLQAYAPHYETVKRLLGNRERFHRPYNQAEIKAGIYFAGNLYDGRHLTPDERREILDANYVFREIVKRNPELSETVSLSGDPFAVRIIQPAQPHNAFTEAWLQSTERTI